jgi:hypothetical protein
MKKNKILKIIAATAVCIVLLGVVLSFMRTDDAAISTTTTSQNPLPHSAAPQVAVLQTYDGVAEHAQANIDSCDATRIKPLLAQQYKARFARGQDLASGIKQHELTKDTAAYILQASGLTYLQYLRYSAAHSQDIDDLPAVDNKPQPLAAEVRWRLNEEILNSSASELGEKIAQFGISDSTIVGGKSIITTLLLGHKLASDSDIHQFIASSKLSPNFADLVVAIRSRQSSATIYALAGYYQGDLTKTWREHLVTNNLVTYSARYGRPDLVEFWLSQGLTPSISNVSGKVMNSMLDMAASYKVPESIALALLTIAEQHDVKAAGFHSYVFFNNIDTKYGGKFQHYLQRMNADLMTHIDTLNIPDAVRAAMIAMAQLNQQIASLEQQAAICGLNDTSPLQPEAANETATAVNRIKDTAVRDSHKNVEAMALYHVLAEEKALLKAKKYNEFLLAVKNNSHKYGDFIVHQALLLCLSEDAPFDVVKSLFDMGGQLDSSAYALLAAKNNTNILKSLVEYGVKVTPTAEEKNNFQKVKLHKTMTPETQRLLKQLGF